jgi:hypothetical protein
VTESGAEATAVQTLARGLGVLELREAFGLRRVHRRFCGCRVVRLQHFKRDLSIASA